MPIFGIAGTLSAILLDCRCDSVLVSQLLSSSGVSLLFGTSVGGVSTTIVELFLIRLLVLDCGVFRGFSITDEKLLKLLCWCDVGGSIGEVFVMWCVGY